jgi:hypothetical protein
MMLCNIYTYNNWALITYLFSGAVKGNSYAVFLDSESEGYSIKLEKLRRVNPYLAAQVNSFAACNVVMFCKKF